LDLTDTILDVIDPRSFSSLWYWIVLAVAWSTASHWVLGVPFDMIARARRHGGEALGDLQDLARINVARLLFVARSSGLWLLGAAAFVLTGLLVLGFWYDVEFAQAVLLIALPMTGVGAMSLAAARRLEAAGLGAGGLGGEALVRALLLHRLRTQLIGMASIFVTALWGMYRNLAALHGL
jgi:hypothetical protein